MPDDDCNLRRAEEHVTEARRLVLRQKGLITRIREAGINTSNAERILKVLDRNLKTFEEHRDALKRRHANVGPSAADEADSAGSQSRQSNLCGKTPRRIRPTAINKISTF